MKDRILYGGLGLLLCTQLISASANQYTTNTPTSYPANTCTVQPDWFAKDNSIVPPKPLVKNNTNCDFHQLSWHYFAWLTEKTANGLRFESFTTDIALEGKTEPANSLPHIFQAGSNGILVDQNGRASYTSMHVNSLFEDFVNTHQLMTANGFEQASPTLSFPDGAMELKASWKIIAPHERDAIEQSGLYVTNKRVKKIITNDFGKVALAPNQPSNYQSETVALVGLHIAVWIKDHPEAIWATFESKLNSPDLVHGTAINSPISANNYLYYSAQSQKMGDKGLTDNTQKDCNILPAPAVVKLNASSQTLSPITQVCRMYQNGGGSSANQNNIRTLNASVHSYPKTPTLLKNYSEIGAVWFDKDVLAQRLAAEKQPGPMLLNWSPVSTQTDIDPIMAGSNQLSSSVIETFTQNNIAENNCFACHNTASAVGDRNLADIQAKTINLSHILKLNYLDIKANHGASK